MSQIGDYLQHIYVTDNLHQNYLKTPTNQEQEEKQFNSMMAKDLKKQFRGKDTQITKSIRK